MNKLKKFLIIFCAFKVGKAVADTIKEMDN